MRSILVGVALAASSCVQSTSTEQTDERVLIADANILTSYRLTLDEADVTVESDIGQFDVPRAKRGGLGLAFMGMLIPSRHEETGDAFDVANQRIDEMLRIVDASDDLQLVRSRDDAVRVFDEGDVGIALAIENGIAVHDSMSNLHELYGRGVRMITIVHSRPNQIGNSSFSNERPWDGLSPFGRDLVEAMNAAGMIIDVAHIADDAFDDVIELSKAPVIASHTSCRRFTPGWERNLDDERIERLARNGGVIHITFGGSFLTSEIQEREQPVWDHIEGQGISINSVRGHQLSHEYREQHGIGYASISDVVDHIDHAVSLVGVDHVGLGSGFDGSGDCMPTGLRDVSDYGALVDALKERGYTEHEIEKIASGNLLRVWAEVERVSTQYPSTPEPR